MVEERVIQDIGASHGIIIGSEVNWNETAKVEEAEEGGRSEDDGDDDEDEDDENRRKSSDDE